MAGNRAAYRYAKALFSLASDDNKSSEVEADMRLIDQTIRESKDLRVMLKSPVIKSELKLSSLEAVFKDAGKYTINLFKVLIENKRIGLLPQVAKSFIELVDQANKVTTAEVTTAVPLTEDMEKSILDKVKELTGNKATLIKKIDENLIGGFLLRIGDIQYDASISGRLTSLKHKFKQNAQV